MSTVETRLERPEAIAIAKRFVGLIDDACEVLEIPYRDPWERT